jgi:putative nucleotidyltransferase with HDIG domain
MMDAAPTLAQPSVEGEPDWRSAATIAAGLEAALRARAPEVHAGTALVRKLAVQVTRQMGLDPRQRAAVDVCAQVRDIGMIALPDAVVLNTGSLSPSDWALLNRHAVLGAELLESIPPMAGVAEIVRAHHERWDGEGYPDGLVGEAIPLASRVVAVCDAFVSIATDGPHRPGVGAEGALAYLHEHRGSQFDPNVVDCLVAAITRSGKAPRRAATGRGVPAPAEAQAETPPASEGRSRRLSTAIAEFGAIPAFGPACERVLTALAFGSPVDRSELVTAVESDTGVTVAVLRRAQTVSRDTPIVNVARALEILTSDEIHAAIASLPRLAFPWHTGFEALLLRSRIHAQSVARAADRLAQVLRPFDTDDLVAVALLHDVGKLLLARAQPEYLTATAGRGTPEELVRLERREFGIDHASLGGLMLERWGLTESLVTAVAGHHTSMSGGSAAAFIRLADMVAHHAQGGAVDRSVMLRLAGACQLSVKTLRDVVFDLPHSGGSQRRRAERSPLSTRESAVLRLLAEGKRNVDIAGELDLSVSTVRTHLHNVYAKLKVPDRAQAVLRATEMAWI